MGVDRWLKCMGEIEQALGETGDSRGTALVTQAQHHENNPRSTGMARNRRLTTNKPRSEIALVFQYSVSYISICELPA